jgi:hypothetical protein
LYTEAFKWYSKDVQQFIRENIHADIHQLVLNPPLEHKDNIKLIAEQIRSRQKIKGKIPEWYENDDILLPPPLNIEQASSSITAEYKKKLIRGSHLIDLTGGSGVDLFFLSENFESVTYVEPQDLLCSLFRFNSKVFNKSVDIFQMTAETFIKEYPPENATIYLDPSRRKEDRRVFLLEDCEPHIQSLIPALLSRNNQLLVKLSPLLDVQSLLKEVVHLKELHIISVKNDCKEVLLLIQPRYNEETCIKAINLETDNPDFCFMLSEEAKASATFAGVSQFLYEPNHSIMKAGAFNLIAQRFQLQKIAPNTHFYTSQERADRFPGRVWEVIRTFDKKTDARSTFNILARNYPLKPEGIKKNYQLTEGGDRYLIGFRDHQHKPHLIIAERIT